LVEKNGLAAWTPSNCKEWLAVKAVTGKKEIDLAKCYWGLACKYYKQQFRVSVFGDNGTLRHGSIYFGLVAALPVAIYTGQFHDRQALSQFSRMKDTLGSEGRE